jgi:hypothetical protein
MIGRVHAITGTTPTRIPRVAPNVSRKPASTISSGLWATRQVAERASVLSGGARWSMARATRKTDAAKVVLVTDASAPTSDP